jgi:hypothetical protein
MFDAFAAQRLSDLLILGLAGVGLLLGFATGLGQPGSWRNVNAVLVARYYSERPEPRRSGSHFARGMFLAAVLPFVAFLKGWCPGFAGQHALFVAGLVACAISTDLWLLVALIFRQSVKGERAARIDQFVSDSTATVPAPVADKLPLWLSVWKWGNTALFVLLMGSLVRGLLALPMAS